MSRVIDGIYIEINNSLPILDDISLLKLCMGKACNIRRYLNKIESIGSNYTGSLYTYENRIILHKNKNI